MKAIAIRAHGGPEAVNLVELPDPTVGPGQVVVAVKAAAQNHLDIWVRIGWSGLKLAFPHVLGSDVAGVVEAIGPGVEGMTVGDAVVVNPSLGCGRCERCLSGNENLCRRFAILGEHVSGGMAEKLAVPARNVLPKPANLSFVEAAAVPLTFMTAWHALVVRAQLRLGEKLRRAKDLGADEVVNYETQDFVQEVRRLTDKRGVEVVFEHVGKKTWEKSILSAGIGGRIVTVGATTGYDPLTDLRHVFFRQLSVLGSTMGTAADLVQVLRYVGEGKLRPVVDRTLPLADARKGQALLAERAQFGKIVLEP